MSEIRKLRVLGCLIILFLALGSITSSQKTGGSDTVQEKDCVTGLMTCDVVIDTTDGRSIVGRFVGKDAGGMYVKDMGETKYVPSLSIAFYKFVKANTETTVPRPKPDSAKSSPKQDIEPKKAPKGKMELQIISDPPGATVMINSVNAGKTPYSIFLDNYFFKGAGSFIWSKY